MESRRNLGVKLVLMRRKNYMKKTIIFMIISILICATVLAQNMNFSTPEATFESYLNAAKVRSFALSDSCYTKEFLNFTVNDEEYQSHRYPGQLANSYDEHVGKQYTVERSGNKAIMRFGLEFSRPSPIYFVIEDGLWKMDAMFMFNNIIMDDGTGGWFWRYENKDNEGLWLEK